MRKILLICILFLSPSITAEEVASNPGEKDIPPYPVYRVDNYCKKPAHYNQSCLANAVRNLKNNSMLLFGAHDYFFSKPVEMHSLSHVEIRGTRNTTVLRGNNTVLFSCDSCLDVTVRDLRLESTVFPRTVLRSELPTADTNAVIAIARFGSGHAYIPRENDDDIVPTASGGKCASHCLSEAQTHEAIDVKLIFSNSTNITVQNLSSRYGALLFMDASYVSVIGNYLSGSNTSVGCLTFWRANKTSSNNHHILVSSNEFTNCTYSGVAMVGDDFTVSQNISSYNGESGIKTYQGEGYTATDVTIIDNISHHNWYDGFDISSSFPHTSARRDYYMIRGNESYANRQTGYYGDGQYVTFMQNVAHDNSNVGMLLDFCHALVKQNQSIGNAMDQIQINWGAGRNCVGGSKNRVLDNVTDSRGKANIRGLFDGGVGNILTGNKDSSEPKKARTPRQRGKKKNP